MKAGVCRIRHSLSVILTTVGSVLIMAGLLLAVTGCGRTESTYVPPDDVTFSHLEPDEAAAMIEEGNITLVDVRGEPQFDLEHIPGAICIPYDSEDEVFETALPDKDAVIILYCDYGGISKAAAEHLTADLGYTHVYEFDGLLVWEGETESNLS